MKEFIEILNKNTIRITKNPILLVLFNISINSFILIKF